MKKILLMLFAVCTLCATAQVTTSPVIIPKGYPGEVIITFDPKGGNGGMATATKCFAHTGLITSESKSNGDWKHTVSDWRAADTPELTQVGDKWQLTIPNMYEFYGVDNTTEILAMAFVFHDGKGGSKEGKATGNKDILIFLGEDNSQNDIWADFTPATPVNKARPTGVDMGIYYDENDPTKVTLCTYAASKTQAAKHVLLLGDMTDWKLSNDYQLYKDGNYFWITLTGLEPKKEYRFQYVVVRADGVKVQISDLYSEKVLHPDDAYEPSTVDPTLIGYPLKGADGGYVTVIQPGKEKYKWSDYTLNFKRPNKNNLVIYELWVYDYTAKRSIKGVMDRLDYIQNLGVNAIEVMPVSEFEGNYNWGYSPTHYFAFDKAYGSSEMFKQFVDACHKRGIAVIVDMVFNHATGQNPMNKLYPYGTDLAQNPWFNVTAPHYDNVYEDWNHGFAPAHNMFIRVLKYWLEEYKIDGYRLDISHGLCSDKANTSVDNLIDYYQKGVKAVAPDAYMILEHWGGSMGTERPRLISYGMQCWENTNHAYCQTAMGWLKDGDGFSAANQDGYVTYCESHDEERMQYQCKQYGNGNIKTDESVRLGRVAANVAFNVLLNGSHMLWQFEEIGYDFSINCDLQSPNAYDSGKRCNTKPRPESRGYFSSTNRVNAFKKCAQVIALRTQLLPAVFAGNPTQVHIGSGYVTRTVQWGNNVFAVANFSPTENMSIDLPSGTWYDYLGGATKAATSYSLKPGELKVFTGTPIQAPVIANIEKRDHSAFEEVQMEMPQAKKIIENGQVLIVRGDKVYTITGNLVY
ncbi:MAG: alpha-amylase family glycosyl hydrolase [Paludibacteraceae bacterium]|nr:alpha-amylase family glycosyl hydrolase [Paludibacteraceae bacterium]